MLTRATAQVETLLKENSAAHDHALIHTPHDMLPSAEPTSSLHTRLLPDHIIPPPADNFQASPFSPNSSSTAQSPGQAGNPNNFAQPAWPGTPQNVDPMLNWEMIALGMEEPLPSQDIMDNLYAQRHFLFNILRMEGEKSFEGSSYGCLLDSRVFMSRRTVCADDFCLFEKTPNLLRQDPTFHTNYPQTSISRQFGRASC